MNKEAIIVGESYECRKTDFARPIIGEVIRKENNGCIVNADKIDQVNGQVLIKYSEVAGIVSKECFFS